jgi:hypothetical protein
MRLRFTTSKGLSIMKQPTLFDQVQETRDSPAIQIVTLDNGCRISYGLPLPDKKDLTLDWVRLNNATDD